MTLVVPFDGSGLAEAALVRAVEFGTILDEEVLAVSIIPEGNDRYARDHGWIGPSENFDTRTVVSRLHRQAMSLAPSADFRHKTVGRHARAGTISGRVRQLAKDEDASMVFIGSENAGRLVVGVSSVGGKIATDSAYDVVIVRDRSPAKVAKLRTASPHRPPKSNFYLSE